MTEEPYLSLQDNDRLAARGPARRLMLLRHAKSAWDSPSMDDHDRPLAPRGVRAARVMGRFMADQRLFPSLILCSSAQRTQDTLEVLVSEWPEVPKTLVEHGLYLAGEPAIIARIRELPDTVSSVLVVGHNPDMQQLVLRLSEPEEMDRKLRDAIAMKHPTGTLAVLDFFASSWSDIAPFGGILRAYVPPRGLE